VTSRKPRWYEGGLRFGCHQCHACCRGTAPGWVYVTRRQVERIASWLGMPLRRFRQRFLTRDEDGEAVLTLKENGDCIFWKDGCTIYPVRPRQCRTFPFWAENLETREAWMGLESFCHGVNDGKLYSITEIESIFHGRATD
jgi:Fe-S-cluster containining protein